MLRRSALPCPALARDLEALDTRAAQVVLHRGQSKAKNRTDSMMAWHGIALHYQWRQRCFAASTMDGHPWPGAAAALYPASSREQGTVCNLEVGD
jgi:hypothetical protein